MNLKEKIENKQATIQPTRDDDSWSELLPELGGQGQATFVVN